MPDIEQYSIVCQSKGARVFAVLMEHVELICRTDADCIGIGDDWERPRNKNKADIDWRFTPADARIRLKRPYPTI